MNNTHSGCAINAERGKFFTLMNLIISPESPLYRPPLDVEITSRCGQNPDIGVPSTACKKACIRHGVCLRATTNPELVIPAAPSNESLSLFTSSPSEPIPSDKLAPRERNSGRGLPGRRPSQSAYCRQGVSPFEPLREEWALRYRYPLSACSVDTFGRAEISIGVALRTATVGAGTVIL